MLVLNLTHVHIPVEREKGRGKHQGRSKNIDQILKCTSLQKHFFKRHCVLYSVTLHNTTLGNQVVLSFSPVIGALCPMRSQIPVKLCPSDDKGQPLHSNRVYLKDFFELLVTVSSSSASNIANLMAPPSQSLGWCLDTKKLTACNLHSSVNPP